MKKGINQINLKDNLYITNDTKIPEGAKRMLSCTSNIFMSEEEAKWYVLEKNGKFKNYYKNESLFTAKESMASALKAISGKYDVSKVRFTIFIQHN
jgi:hypothetical protein